jgi:hypothetical protein
MGVLAKRCLRRSRLAGELFEDWQINHRLAILACDLEQLAAECTEVGKLVKHSWAAIVDLLFTGTIENPDETGDTMRLAIAKTRETLDAVNNVIKAFEKSDHNIKQASDLRLILHEIEHVAIDFDKTWPIANIQMAQEALEAFRKGDFKTAEDLHREAQGHFAGTDS